MGVRPFYIPLIIATSLVLLLAATEASILPMSNHPGH